MVDKLSINKDYIDEEFIKDLRNTISVIDGIKVDIAMKVDLFRIFFEGWQLGKEAVLIAVGLSPGDFRNYFINDLSGILHSVELGEYTPSEGWYQLTNIVKKD